MQQAKRKFPHNRREVDQALRARWQSRAEGATNKRLATERAIHHKLTTAPEAGIEGLR
jgi:uncharacterized protein YdaU (DUF1376 family)